MKPQIKFQHNWNNKLDRGIFTTIRNFEKEKADWYISQVGQIFDVIVDGVFTGEAKLIDVSFQNIHWLPFGLLACDTGLTDRKEIFDLFNKFGCKGLCLLLTFETITPGFKRADETQRTFG